MTQNLNKEKIKDIFHIALAQKMNPKYSGAVIDIYETLFTYRVHTILPYATGVGCTSNIVIPKIECFNVDIDDFANLTNNYMEALNYDINWYEKTRQEIAQEMESGEE